MVRMSSTSHSDWHVGQQFRAALSHLKCIPVTLVSCGDLCDVMTPDLPLYAFLTEQVAAWQRRDPMVAGILARLQTDGTIGRNNWIAYLLFRWRALSKHVKKDSE